jgi:hypothetical protein
VRGIWKDSSYAEDCESYVMGALETEHFYKTPYGETTALSKRGLSHNVYWSRLLSFNRI